MAPDDMIAIAFVVDSSAALHAEWPALLQNYVMPMLRRIGESCPPNTKFRAAFVTYGTQGNSLLCKNFFHDLYGIMPAFRDEPAKLGLGQTSYGGDMGMAALEGFVAALELFDLLRQTAEVQNSSCPPIYHIFHFAAAMPDSAERPQCNMSPILDSVTWDSLPSEMKKAPAKCPPELDQRPAQTPEILRAYSCVKRAGEPMTATPDPKRSRISLPNTSPKNTQINHAPPRTQTPATGATTIPPAAMRIPTPSGPLATNNLMIPPTSAPAGAPTNPMQFAQERMLQFHNALRATEQAVRQLAASLAEARQKGDAQLVEQLMPQWTEKSATYMKLKQTLHAFQQRAAYQAMANQQGQAAQAQANAQRQGQMGQPGQGQGLAQGQPGHAQGQPGQMVQQDEGDVQMGGPDSGGGDDNNMMASQPPIPPGNAGAPGHMRSLSGGGQARPSMPMNPGAMGASPMINQQMQKMIEQQERSRQNTAQPQPKQNNSPAVWQGRMSWSGTTPAGEPREVATFVIANSATPEACHADTWPTHLVLTIAEKPAVSLRDLQIWMKRVDPALCTFRPNPTAENSPHNEMAYKALVAMLVTKKLYFVVSWTLPNGKTSNNVLLFPVHNAGLVGAFFPMTGIPDMPQELPGNPSIIPNPTPANPPTQSLPQTQPQPGAPQNPQNPQNPQLMMQIDTYMKQHGVGLPPMFIAQLIKLPQAQRNAQMQKLIQTGQEQRRQKLAGAAAGGGPGAMGGANAGAGPGMGMPQTGMMPQHQQPQQRQTEMGGFNSGQFALGGGAGGGMGGGMGGMGGGGSGMYPDIMAGAGLPRTASNSGGGGGGAVSYEMMQSFMQRNQEIGGGGPSS
ncbi:hypothetical protein C8R47DRAFT_1064598 [Mycena vitilis]|nr:hypothetical protein C8R47DRAFT_1064598 [Mycena vitilis]